MVFEGAGQKEGLEIFRIEDFNPVPYKNHGKFHVGDSYIVLSTKKTGSSFSWDVHFWLGDESSQDERGAAAMLSVELDDKLGGSPTQHRELQEAESQRFLSYFKAGLKYLPGGVKSGFTKFDPEEVEKRMFRVKGKRNVQIKEVPLDISSMNKGDCFILDGGKRFSILVYMPEGAKKMEQFRAVQVANQIRDEDHAGNAEVEVVDRHTGNHAKFFEVLGSGSPDEVPEDTGDDEKAEADAKRETCLYKIEDSTFKKIASPPLRQSMLETDDAFILSAGQAGLFVWIGKDASKEEKVKAMAEAENLLKNLSLPKGTNITRLVEGTETAVFKSFFVEWKDEDASIPGRCLWAEGAVAEWNIGDLHFDEKKRIAKSAGAAVGFMPDDASGVKKIWRVEDMDLVELEESKHGFFFAGDSYVIQYNYGDGESILYFWQGSKSSIDERGASAIHAQRIDDTELGGKAVQVRVGQGEEPRHFIKMFAGKMVVFSGGKASGFNNVHERDDYDTDGTMLFKVRCASGESDARATQVEEVGASLSSDDVFVLETPGGTYIWVGQDCCEEEESQAVRLAQVLSPGRKHSNVKQGEEPAEFWAALGGEVEVKNLDTLSRPARSPRLFHIDEKRWKGYRAFEIFDFEKSDLETDDCYLLDMGEELYVWVGGEVGGSERENSAKMARQYLDSDPTERTADTAVIITVAQDREPASFKAAFQSWN